jgi:hypothetical protein
MDSKLAASPRRGTMPHVICAQKSGNETSL